MDNKTEKRQLNNQGFSLVELIVVMIIMVIMATAVVVGFVNSSAQKVKASTELITKYLNNTLSYSLSKGATYFEIKYDSDRYTVRTKYGTGAGEESSEQLEKGVVVTYDIENGDTGNTFSEESNTLRLSYNRNNGSFTPIITAVDDNTMTLTTDTANRKVSDIYITCNDSGKRVHLYTKTGEYEVFDYEPSTNNTTNQTGQ